MSGDCQAYCWFKLNFITPHKKILAPRLFDIIIYRSLINFGLCVWQGTGSWPTAHEFGTVAAVMIEMKIIPTCAATRFCGALLRKMLLGPCGLYLSSCTVQCTTCTPIKWKKFSAATITFGRPQIRDNIYGLKFLIYFQEV